MTPVSNNNPSSLPPLKRASSSKAAAPQRPTKYLKNEDGDRVATTTSELSTRIIEESNSPDRMDIVQDDAIPSSGSSLTRRASYPNLTASTNEFLKSVNEQKNLPDLIETLISQKIFDRVLAQIPWHELDDTQKNNLFSCFFKIVSRSDYLRDYLIRTLRNLIPTTAQDYVPILPLNPTSIVYVGGIQHHFPEVFKAYVRLVVNYSSEDVFFVPRDTISTQTAHPNHFVQMPKELATTIKKELPCYFTKVPLSFPLPYSIENYFFSCFAHVFGTYDFDLPQSAGATAVDYLTQCREYDSSEFNRFYKSAGPFLCSKTEKATLQDPRLALFWQDYLYLSFTETSEGLLIAKEELLGLDYFKMKEHFKNIDSVNYPEIEMVSLEFHPTDFFYFFKAIRFHQLPLIAFDRLLRLLNLAEELYCPKLKQLIEPRILTEIPHLDLDLETLLNLFDYTHCSLVIKQAARDLFWKIAPELVQDANQLTGFKRHIDYLPEDLPIGWNRFIPSLAENISSTSFSNDNFQHLKYFKKLESIRLNHCTLSQSLYSKFSSMKAVEINGWKGPLEVPSTPLLWEKVKLVQTPSNTPGRFEIELTRFPLDLLRALKEVTHLEIESDFNSPILPAIEPLKTLEHLSIKSLSSFDFTSLARCLRQLPNLKSLSLAGNIRFNSDYCRPLLSLENVSLSFTVPPAMLAVFPNVKHLNFITASFEVSLNEINRLHNLENLTIVEEEPQVHIDPSVPNQPRLPRGVALTGLSFSFKNLENLKIAHFSFQHEVASYILNTLADSVNLREITLISKQNFFKEIYLEIIKKPNLERFSFSTPESLYQLQSIYAHALENDIELNLL